MTPAGDKELMAEGARGAENNGRDAGGDSIYGRLIESGARVKTDGGGDEAGSYGDSGATTTAILTTIQTAMTKAAPVLPLRPERRC